MKEPIKKIKEEENTEGMAMIKDRINEHSLEYQRILDVNKSGLQGEIRMALGLLEVKMANLEGELNVLREHSYLNY